jgi:hypothetical protein
MGVAAVKHTQLNSHQTITLSRLPLVSSVQKMAISFLKLLAKLSQEATKLECMEQNLEYNLQVVFASPP